MAGTLTISTLSDGTNSTSATNPIKGSAKAWVQFGHNGTTTVIAASYNVSSVTRNAAGIYTIAMTNALADANYSVVGTSSIDYTASYLLTSFINFSTTAPYYVAPTSSQFVMGYTYGNSVGQTGNPVYASVAVFD